MRRSRSRHSRSGRAGATLSLLALGFSGLLSALSLVTWRQSRAFEALAELDSLERSLSLAESERTELLGRIQSVASLDRMSPVAQERLGMHHPDASEMVFLSGGAQ